MSKVAIVGVEGSGKTVLMAALAEKYGTISSDAVYLMPENQSAFAFMTHIPYRLRKEHTWPQATTIDALRLMRWTLRVGTDVLSEMEMLDYPGELYRMAFGERDEKELAAHRAEVHEFLEHLVGAELLVVLLNLNDILGIGDNPRNAETVWITRGIFDYAKMVPSIKEVLLVFTQADRYSDVLKAEGGTTEILKKHLPMIHVLYPNLECMTVAAVDATDARGNPRENYSSQGIQPLMDRIICPAGLKKSLDAAVAVCDRCAAGISNITTLEELDKLLSKYRAALDAEVFKKRVARYILPPNVLADHESRFTSHSSLLQEILSIMDISSMDAWRRLTTNTLNGLSEESMQRRFHINAHLADEQTWKSMSQATLGNLPCAKPIITNLRVVHRDRSRIIRAEIAKAKASETRVVIIGGVLIFGVYGILLVIILSFVLAKIPGCLK
jgi:hypothetical protein